MGLTKPRASQIYNLDYKQATRVVTVANVNLSGGAPSQVDGVTLSTNDRILVTGQSTTSQNGLYNVFTVGSGTNGTWVRTSDGNETGEIEAGMIVMVTEGVVYADTQWKLITDNPINIGTTALIFTQNYSANSISGGTSNVTVYSNANVTISSAGTPNVFVVSSTGTVTSGTNLVTGNITGGNILTAGQVSATGNLSGNYLLANIAYATGYTASRIYNGISEVNIATANGNANISINGTSNVTVFTTTGQYVTGLISATGNIVGNNLTVNNIESVTGNITGGNILTGGLISSTGNITTAGNVSGNYLLANIYYATGFSASRIFNGTSEANIGISGGNANISIGGIANVVVVATTGEYVTGIISATGNIIGSNIIGNGAQLTGINSFGTIQVGGQSNIVANSINTSVTFAAGSGLALTTDASNNILTISSVSTTSIFATGGSMGTITETVTTTQNLGLITDAVTVSYNLGSVIDASGLVYPSQLVLPTYTPGTLPSANPAAQFIYLSTSSIGSMTAFSDGTNWRFTSSGNIVS